MALFKKLKSGAILFVTNINDEQKTISGYNLACPILRIDNYSQSQIDQTWKEKSKDISDIFHDTDYLVTADCKYHPAYITQSRWEMINIAILQLLGMEVRSKAKEVSKTIY